MLVQTPRDRELGREQAIRCARSATHRLRSLGVEALVIGSLAKGTFGPFSDVDFLVTVCPRRFKYAIEGMVEEQLGDIPFDLTYLDEVPAHKIASFTECAIDASRLR